MREILTKCCLLVCSWVFVQFSFAQILVTGRVSDKESGEPLVGVTVSLVGSDAAVQTDIEGRYQIAIKAYGQYLRASYIGYEASEIVFEKNVPMDFQLKSIGTSLDEVVVVGYGTQRKETVTGAISSIQTKELVQSPVANISNSLAGRLPGLTAIQRSGEPGLDASSIKIRGIGSLSTGSGSDPLILIDGVPRDNMNQLDPHEIDNLTILKDASATAVYGVRGANGVILITTKRGRTGAPSISFSSNVGVQTPSKLPDFLDSYNYALLKNEAYTNDGEGAPFTAEELEKFRTNSDPIVYPSNNWMDVLIKDRSVQQQYNLNVSGGVDYLRYFVSAGFFDQPGNFNTGDFDYGFDPNPKYKRYNIRSNIDIDFTDRLSGSVRMGSQYGLRNFHPTTGSSMFFNILNTAPYSGPGIVDGKLVDSYINDPLGWMAIESRGYSVFKDVLDNGYRTESINDINLNFSLNYDLSFLVEGLSAKAMYAYDNKYTRIVNRNKEIDVYSILVHEDGSTSLIQQSDEGSFTYGFGGAEGYRKNYFESSLNYSGSFSGHNIGGLILYNQSKEHDKSYQYAVPRTILGFAGRVTYSYKDRYLAELNVGYNGSENFPDNKRFGFFPAYSLGWVASNESFFPKQFPVSYLKIRGSYGEVGNDKIGGDRFLYLPSTYTYLTGGTNGYYFGEYGVNRSKYNGSRENKIGNPNVTWERAVKANIGFELGVINNQLYLTADYFQENRDNILVNLGTVPDLVAASLPAANLGKVSNKGFEVELSWRSNINEDFSYHVSANLAYSKNKILFRDEPTPLYPWMGQTGYSIGQIKGYVSNGFYNTPEELDVRPYYTFSGNVVDRGDLKYVDIDGDGRIDQNDVVPVGYNNIIPEFSGGLSAGFNYKNIDASFLISGMANYSGMFTEILGWAFDWNNRQTLAKFTDRWSEERYEAGESILYPKVHIRGNLSPNGQQSDFLVQNMSHLRLKNVEIGYSLNPSFTRRIKIDRVRFYVNGNNLFFLSQLKDMDPDSQSGSRPLYPQMKVVNVGANLQF